MKRLGMMEAFTHNSIWAQQKQSIIVHRHSSPNRGKIGACRRHPTRPLIPIPLKTRAR